MLSLASSSHVTAELVILVGAAVVGGFAANLLRLPVIAGYIIGGLIVGPSVANLVLDIEDVAFITELGIALLLFTIGLEFPLQQFRRLGGRLLGAATVQMVVLGAVGYVIGQAFGLSSSACVLIGGATAFSSTALLVRVLSQSGDRKRVAGQWALGIALTQDLVAVPLLVVLPQIGESSGSALVEDILISIGKGVGLVVAVLVIGRIVIPWALRQVLETRSRELFLLATFAVASGIALGSFAAGLSLAFGAFLAGLATAQSPYAARALHELVPLRDLFAATFFVSVGVLLDLAVVAEEWGLFLSLLAWGALGKIILIFVLAQWARFDAKRALRIGLLLGQMGEFAFLLASVATANAANEAGPVVIAVGTVSMALSAIALRFSARLEQAIERVRFVRRPPAATLHSGAETAELKQHTVICGYGDTGRELAHILDSRGFRYLVIDSDPGLLDELGGGAVPYIWGDLANAATLDEAQLDSARVVAVTLSDPLVSEAIVERVRREHPRLHIVARGSGPDVAVRLTAAGANAVVDPSLEGGFEIAHHTLHRYGITLQEIRQTLVGRRQEHFG